MFLLNVALVALSIVAAQGLTTQCLTGPSFWCLSRENAGKCGMTDYCTKNIWNNNIPTVFGGDEGASTTCDLCHNIYDQLHLFSQSGGDLNILQRLDKSLCPNENADCLKKTQTIYNRIDEFLSAKDGDTACTQFQFCGSEKMFIEVTDYAKLLSGFQCTGCQYIISELKASIAEVSEEDIEKMMEEACNTWKLDSDCETMAKKYAKEVQLFIETLDKGELCTDIGMCNNDFISLEHFKYEMNEIISQNNADKDNDNNINACSVCKIAISVAEMQLKVINLTLTTGNYIMNQLCSMFGNSYCYKLQQVIMSVQSKLSTLIDPSAVCEMLNVCNNGIGTIEATELEPSLEGRQLQNLVKKFIETFM